MAHLLRHQRSESHLRAARLWNARAKAGVEGATRPADNAHKEVAAAGSAASPEVAAAGSAASPEHPRLEAADFVCVRTRLQTWFLQQLGRLGCRFGRDIFGKAAAAERVQAWVPDAGFVRAFCYSTSADGWGGLLVAGGWTGPCIPGGRRGSGLEVSDFPSRGCFSRDCSYLG